MKAPAIVAALMLAATAAAAQSVRGTVVDTTRGRAPVASSTVLLLDLDGRIVAATISNDRGAYSLRAPASGRYRVRVDRVGFKSATSPTLPVASGETVEHDIQLVVHEMVLAPIRSVAESQCRVEQLDGEAAAQLWEEARKALHAVVVGRSVNAFRMRIRHFERELDPTLTLTRGYREWEQQGETPAPFKAASAAVLARDGFIVRAGQDFIYHAPDAEVLISPEFVSSHCFRAVRGGPERPGLVGLRFDPVRRDRSDVQGALWMDPRSWELRELEYQYTNVPYDATSSTVGGRVQYSRLPDGRWYIAQWQIRMPLVEQAFVGQRGAGSADTRIRGYLENGAQVVAMDDERRIRVGGGRGRVVGTVFDSLRGKPASGIRVFLSGTQYFTTTGNDGSFVIDSVPAGFYTASAMLPSADSVFLAHPSTQVGVSRDADVTVPLATPSRATVTSNLCARAAAGAEGPLDLATLVGRVHLPPEVAPDSVRVVATWRQPGGVSGNVASILSMRRESTLGSDGRYLTCRVKAFREVTLTVFVGRSSRGSVTVELEPDEVKRVDLRVRP